MDAPQPNTEDVPARDALLLACEATEAFLLWARCLATGDVSERDLQTNFDRLLGLFRQRADEFRQVRRVRAR